ncbi:transcription factor IIA subunit alpha [Coemansia sp. RSA 552]|nr:transcription factor IIA subunit alpha [Coemansia sp. RSA 552]
MSNAIVAAIYRYVIDDVVRNVQGDFEGHGVDTSVLEELQRSWEAKIVQSRVASFPGEDAAAMGAYAQPGNMRMPNSAPQGAGYAAYQQQHPPGTAAAAAAAAAAAVAAANNVNSAASLASIINNPESVAPSAASLASLAQSGRTQLLEEEEDHHHSHHHHGGAPNSDPRQYHARQYAPPGHYPNPNIPQNDGAADEPAADGGLDSSTAMAKWKEAVRERRARAIAQVDGASDDEDDGKDEEPAKVENPEDAINSDLDDTDEDDDDGGGGEETEHIILCQYEKVTRTKNKWKCVLRDGIMLINGRDYLFHKANGDFEW